MGTHTGLEGFGHVIEIWTYFGHAIGILSRTWWVWTHGELETWTATSQIHNTPLEVGLRRGDNNRQSQE